MFLWEGSRSFKIYKLENIYDNIGMDHGASHVRRFAHPYAVKDEYIISSLKNLVIAIMEKIDSKLSRND